MLRAKRAKSIKDILEEVEALIDTHFFTEFEGTKSSMFLNKLVANQGSIEMNIYKKAWITLNRFHKTLKVIREIQENDLCVGNRREMIAKKKADAK